MKTALPSHFSYWFQFIINKQVKLARIKCYNSRRCKTFLRLLLYKQYKYSKIPLSGLSGRSKSESSY